ncbi:hypothetical protein CJF32_00006896 [Rutstroemia sp. NJR-2017a WRK4]|nr:hypothetical protein CJF32_00006896 [Rutstroemia sp. NJR-2017a WRK4]
MPRRGTPWLSHPKKSTPFLGFPHAWIASNIYMYVSHADTDTILDLFRREKRGASFAAFDLVILAYPIIAHICSRFVAK